MSDLLKEIYIKQAQREKAAGTESEKIASLNAAYAQAEKVKKQREINALRQKSADLKVKSINQKVAAAKAQQSAEEKISREQQLQNLNHDFYLSMLEKGIYDPNAAQALGVSETAYKGALEKVKADIAARNAAASGGSIEDVGGTGGDPTKDIKELNETAEQKVRKLLGLKDGVEISEEHKQLYNELAAQTTIGVLANEKSTKPLTSEERAAKRRAMNDDVSGVGQRNLNKSTEKKKQVAQIEKQQAVDTKTATMVYNLNTAIQKHGKDKVLASVVKYVDKSGDTQKTLEKIFDSTINKKQILGTNQRAFLTILRDDSRISEEDRKSISAVLDIDKAYRLKTYQEFLEGLDDEALKKEIEKPSEQFQMSTVVKQGMAQAHLNAKQDKIVQELVKQHSGSDEVTPQSMKETVQVLQEDIKALTEDYNKLHGAQFGRSTKVDDMIQYSQQVIKIQEEISKKKEQLALLENSSSSIYQSDYESAIEADAKQVKKWIEEGKKKAGNLTVEYQVDEKGKSYLTMTAGEGVIGTGWRHFKNTGLYALTVALTGGLPGASEVAYNFVSRKANPDLEDNFASYQFNLDDLTEDEKEVLYYYLGRYGDDEQKAHNNEAQSAFAYIDSIADRVMMRKAKEQVSGSAFYETIKRLHDGVAENVNSLALNITKNLSGMQSKYTAPSAYRWEAAKDKHGMDQWYETAAGDVLYAIGDQIPRVVVTMALNYVAPVVGSVASTALFATQTGMRDLNDKIASGWSTEDALGYTVLNTAFQTVSEKLFNAFGVDEQMGFVTKAFKKQIENVAKKAGGKLILNVFSSFAQEGFEEMIQNVGEQVLNSAFDPQGNLIENFDLEGMLYDGLIGALTGAAGTSPQVAGFTVDTVRGVAQKQTQRSVMTKNSEELKAEIVAASKIKKVTAHAYDVVYNAAQSGMTLDAARKLAGQINRMSREAGKAKALDGRDINRAYAMGKVDFKTMLDGAARASFESCGLNVSAQNAWIALYNAGYAGETVESFTGLPLPVKAAKAAYEFGKAAQASTEDAEAVAQYEENTEQEQSQDSFVSASAPTGTEDSSSEAMEAVYYAGKTGASLESVYDGEITETVQNVYAAGQRDGGKVGSTNVVINKGKGEYSDTTSSKSDMEDFLIKFAKKTGIDVERVSKIAVKYKDGIKENGAAGKFVADLLKILVSEKAVSERRAFGHEVGETLQALLGDEFDALGKVLIDYYLSEHTVDDLENLILTEQAKYGEVSETTYPEARKEVICNLLGELIDNDRNFKALVDWVNASDMSAKEKTGFIEKLKKLVKKIVDILKSIGSDEYIGTGKRDQQILNKPSAEMQAFLKSLDALVERVNSLQDGDMIEIRGKEGEPQYAIAGQIETEDEVYNRIGWVYNILTPQEMNIIQKQIAEAGIQGYDSFCSFTDSSTNQTMLALAANNRIVIVNDDFEFPTVHAIVKVSSMLSVDINDILKDVKEIYDVEYNKKRRPKSALTQFIKGIQNWCGKTFTLVYLRINYIGAGTHGTRRNQGAGAYRNGGKSGKNSGGKQYGRRNSRKDVHVVGAHDNDNGTMTVYYSNGAQRVYKKGTKGSVRYSLDTDTTDDHAVAELTAQSNALKDQTLGKYTTQMDEPATQSDALSQFDIENDIGLYDDPLYPTSKRDQSAFDRSLANKTSGLKNGKVSGVIIYTANHCYFVVADGYMHGYIYKRMGITGNKTIFKDLQEEFINGFNEDGKDIDGDFEIMWGRNGRRSRNTLTAAKRGGTEKIVSLDDGKSGRSNVGDDTQGYGVVGRIDNTAEFIPQNRKRHITNSVLYPDNKVERIRFNRELSERSTINQVNNIFIETKYHCYFVVSDDYYDGRIVHRVDWIDDESIRKAIKLDFESGKIIDPKSIDEQIERYRSFTDSSVKRVMVDENDSTENVFEQSYALDMTQVDKTSLEKNRAASRVKRDETLGKYTTQMDEQARSGGRVPQGERVKRDIAVPRKVNGKKTMRWARTFFESGVGTPEMVEPVAEELLNEGLSYKVVSNETAMNAAERIIEQKGYEGAIADLEGQVDNGQFSKEAAALGQLLLNTASEAKDYHNFKKLVVLISEMGVNAGQTVQALSMLKRMDGETKLFAIQRTVNRLNRELAAGKYGKKNINIKVTLKDGAKGGSVITVDPELIRRLLEAGQDDEASSAVTTEIYKDMGRQLPRGDFNDGWNAWRYFAMLCAPTTHVRNMMGNAAFMPLVAMKNSLKRVAELMLIRDGDERTAKILPASKKAREFAKADALKMETILKSGGKYNEADVIEQVRKKLPGFLDKLEKFNSGALEWEDWRFLKYHYVSTLSRYLDVNHIDPDSITAEQLARARNYATSEAMKATYRDGSRLAGSLNELSKKNKVFGSILEGVLPFKKTPINVLRRGIEYSPLGLIKTMTLGTFNVYNKKITLNEWLDGFCAGLSGTLITALGALAYSLGLVQGGFGRDDDDPEDKAQDDLKKLSGLQEYSIIIGDISYTIDWAAPAAIPFFMGVEIAEAFAEEDGNLWDRVMDAIVDGTDVIVNTSMLDGLQGTIDAIKYESGSLFAIAENSLVNYAAQALPAVFGKSANLFDGTRRSNYVDPDSKWPEDLQRIGNKIIAKIPGLSGKRNAYIDEFGREKTEKNWALRFFQNFISPGYYSRIEYGELEEMMSEIYANAEEPAIIPTTASKSFMLNGERVYLSAKEYEQFAKQRGQIAHKIMTQMIRSDNFDDLSYDEMQEVLKKAYEYSGAVAKSEVSDYELDEWQAQAAKLEKKGMSVSDFILYRHLTTNEDYEREDVVEKLQQAGLSYYDARRHLSSIQTKFKKDYEKEGISIESTVGAAIDMEKGDYGSYQSAVDKIVSMGHSKEDAIKAIHVEAGISCDYVEGSIYTSSDLYNALVTNSDYYTTIYNSLVSAKVKSGKKVSTARSSIKTGLSKRFRTAYEKGDGEARKQIKEQMIRSGLYGTNSNVVNIIYKWGKLYS